MKAWHDDGQAQLYLGDCREVLRGLPAESVDCVVTDPPYELGFMGKGWDAAGIAYDASMWHEVKRVAKPGAHFVAFGAPRTYHRLASAIEDAGWEIRDCLMWLFGSGFPKSLNLDGEWDGWGTALKPAWEPIVLARKPLWGTVVGNVAAHGTGALNVDGCRLAVDDRDPNHRYTPSPNGGTSMFGIGGHEGTLTTGRWPANVVLDTEAAAALDEEAGETTSTARPRFNGAYEGFAKGADNPHVSLGHDDSGGPSRFFYTSKASRTEREQGLADMPLVRRSDGREKDIENPRLRTSQRRNHHPTVKPLDLMQWLVRLVTPPGGFILDPFLGSGTTAIAAKAEGFRCIGIEREEEYLEIARRRCAQQGLFVEVTP